MRHEKFDVVIIDEAAQASEPDCWIAIKKANKVILVRPPFCLCILHIL